MVAPQDEAFDFCARSTPSAYVLPNIGDIVDGKYRIDAILGEGGLATVFRAVHLTLDEAFAIKVLLPDFAKRADVVERFVLEGQRAIKIKSEHVFRVFDVGALANGLPFMVMEYLPGVDLEKHLASRGRLEVEEAVGIILQASEALAEAHALGIVHRDVKPANLFLTSNSDGSGCIKVLDFGISETDSGKAPSEVVGSPYYMSPEQLLTPESVDARSDVWALGVVLYELVGGTAPFAGDSLADTYSAILQRDPVRLSTLFDDVDEAFDSVVERCLAKNADDRFSDVAELAEGLAHVFPGAEVSALRMARTLGKVDRCEGVTTGSHEGTFGSIGRVWGRRMVSRQRRAFGLSALVGASAVVLAGLAYRSVDIAAWLGTLDAAYASEPRAEGRAFEPPAFEPPAFGSAKTIVETVPVRPSASFEPPKVAAAVTPTERHRATARAKVAATDNPYEGPEVHEVAPIVTDNPYGTDTPESAR